MRIIYTDHAIDNMYLRAINEDMVEKTIRFPDKVIIGKRIKAIKKIGSKEVKVIYVRKSNKFIIVTVM